MFDVGWTELLLIGVVALIVIGPKDLPMMFHTLGRITARARGMAREFSSAMEDAAKASGLQEATKDLRDLQKMTSPRAMGLDALARGAVRVSGGWSTVEGDWIRFADAWSSAYIKHRTRQAERVKELA